MDRRKFVMSGFAVSSVLAAPNLLRAATDYVMPAAFAPRIVRLKTKLEPGEIHVDPLQFALFLTLPDNKAMRYAIGIGRAGLYESGEFFIGAKKEWPSWTPTKDMIKRDPAHYAKFAKGMPGGPNNPLGARALYLFKHGVGDTFLRIHGTNKPHTIGTAVSNGCARLVNEHAIALYNSVPRGARAVLYPQVASTKVNPCIICENLRPKFILEGGGHLR